MEKINTQDIIPESGTQLYNHRLSVLYSALYSNLYARLPNLKNELDKLQSDDEMRPKLRNEIQIASIIEPAMDNWINDYKGPLYDKLVGVKNTLGLQSYEDSTEGTVVILDHTDKSKALREMVESLKEMARDYNFLVDEREGKTDIVSDGVLRGVISGTGYSVESYEDLHGAEGIFTIETDKGLFRRIKNAEAPDRHQASVKYNRRLHDHVNNGTGGVSFYYDLNTSNNRIRAVVYDYAEKRSGNTYRWKKGSDSSGPSDASLS